MYHLHRIAHLHLDLNLRVNSPSLTHGTKNLVILLDISRLPF